MITRGEHARELRLIAVLVIVALLACYADVIRMLIREWSVNDTYSFGAIVPFISGYLVWLRKDRLSTVPVAPAYLGGSAVLAAAGALLLAGRFATIQALQELSLVPMVAGLILMLLGYRVLLVLCFPLSYLLLMLPVWSVVTDPLQRPFQLFSASTSVSMLHAVGIPVLRDETYLYLPNINLEVARACSGVNYLIAVVALGLPQAYLFLRGLLPRLVSLVFAMAVATVSNGVRIALIGILAYNQASANVHGPGHVLQGLFVSVVGFVAISVGVRMLALRYPRRAEPAQPARDRQAAPKFTERRVVVSGFVAAAVLSALGSVHPANAATALGSDRLVPSVRGSWRLVETAVPGRFIRTKAGYISKGRRYQAPTGETVDLFVSLFAYGDPVTGALDYRSVELPRDGAPVVLRIRDGATWRVNRSTFNEVDQKIDVIYWYDLDGSITPDRSRAQAYTGWKLLTGRGPDAALVLLSTRIDGHNGFGSDLLERFISDSLDPSHTVRSIGNE